MKNTVVPVKNLSLKGWLFLVVFCWIELLNFRTHATPIVTGCQTGLNFTCTGTNPLCFTIPNGYVVSGTESWTSSTFGTSTITVNGTIRVPAGTQLTINSGLTLRFADTRQNYDVTTLNSNRDKASRILVEAGKIVSGSWVNGGKLMIYGGTTLTGLVCGGNEEMWQGIQVLGNGSYQQGVVGGINYQGMLTTRNYLNTSNRVVIKNALIGVLCGEEYYYNNPVLYNAGVGLDNGGGFFNCTYTDFINCYIGSRVWDYQYNSIQRTRFSKSTFQSTAVLVGPGFTSAVTAYGLDFKNINRINVRGNTFISTISGRQYNQRGTGILCREDVGLHLASSCDELVPVSGCYGDPNHFENLSYGIQAENNPATQHFQVLNAEFENNWRGVRLVDVAYPTIEANDFDIPYLSDTPGASTQNYGLYLESCTGYDVEGNSFTGEEPTATIGTIVDNSIESTRNGVTNQIYRNTYDNLEVGAQAQGTNGGADPLTLDPYGLVYDCNDFLETEFDVADIYVSYLSTINPMQGQCFLSQQYGSPVFNRFYDDCSTNGNEHIESVSQTIDYNPETVNSVYIPDCVTTSTVFVGGCNSTEDHEEHCADYLVFSDKLEEEDEDEEAAGGRFIARVSPVIKSRQKLEGLTSALNASKIAQDSSGQQAVIEQLRQLALHQVIRDYHTDTTASAADSILALLSRETLPSYRVQAANVLLHQGLPALADTHLQYALAQGALDPKTRINVLWAAMPAKTTLDELAISSFAQLNQLAQDTSQVGGDIAKLLAYRVTGDTYRERVHRSTQANTIRMKAPAAQSASNSIMTLQPNPATGFVQVRLEQAIDQGTELQLFNLIGTQVMKLAVVSNQSVVEVSLGDLPSGIYQVILSHNGKVMETQKLAVIR